MSYEEVIGVLSESRQCDGTLVMEWKIPNFVRPLLSGFYRSSSFFFENVYWHFRIHVKANDYCLSVYLKNGDLLTRYVTYSCSIKKTDGTLAWTQSCTSALSNDCDSHPFLSFCLRDATVSEFLPSRALTIVCNLKSGTGVEGTLAPPQKADSLSEMSSVGNMECAKLSETDVLSKNFKDLFNNKEFCDSVLKVRDREFKVHRTVLIARSPVFAAMFKHDTSEKQTGIIDIPDCDEDTFQQFLEYLYSGKMEEISFNNALHLFRTSNKYDVNELKTFCTTYMMQNLTVENVLDVVTLADMYDETKLFSFAQEFFNENFKQIVNACEWKNLLKTNPLLANKLLIQFAEYAH